MRKWITTESPLHQKPPRLEHFVAQSLPQLIGQGYLQTLDPCVALAYVTLAGSPVSMVATHR